MQIISIWMTNLSRFGGKTGFLDYDQIFVTDHCLGVPLCNMVDKEPTLRKKIKIFDHHSSRIGNYDKFPWVNIISERHGRKESGTSLFYQYLCEQGLLKESLDDQTWVELTRLYDTWEWTNVGNQKADNLNTLALAVGREEYITRLLGNHSPFEKFVFDEEENVLIEKYKVAFDEQVKKYAQQIRVVDVDGAKAGIVEISDVYKNDIARVIRTSGNEKGIAFLMMPVLDRNTVSLRAVDDSFDVSKVAERFGGGGHKGAASFPMCNLPKECISKESGK